MLPSFLVCLYTHSFHELPLSILAGAPVYVCLAHNQRIANSNGYSGLQKDVIAERDIDTMSYCLSFSGSELVGGWAPTYQPPGLCSSTRRRSQRSRPLQSKLENNTFKALIIFFPRSCTLLFFSTRNITPYGFCLVHPLPVMSACAISPPELRQTPHNDTLSIP